MRYPINRAYIVMVALDENDHPVPVPQLILENDIQREENLLAQKRRDFRLERRKSGF